MAKIKIFKIICVCVAAVLAAFAMTLPSFAAESGADTLPEDEWNAFEEAIPDDVRDKLIDGADDNAQNFAQSVGEMSKSKYIIGTILDIIGIELVGVVKLFSGLCAVLLVSAIFSALGEGMHNPALFKAVRFCSVGAIISVAIYTQYSHFEMVEEFFEKLGTMINGVIPVTACIWAMGGNVGTASVGSASFSLVLSVTQTIISQTLIPVCSVLTVLGFCDTLTDEIRMGKIMSAIKRIYNFLLVLVMTVLLSSLAAQTAIAASADSTAARTARLVSGTVIPVLGGSVGETFRIVAAGVSYLKNVFGVGSIIMIALLVLPVLITIVLTRFAFLLSAGVADILGCSAEARVLENLGEVYGTMLAVISCVGVTFIMALCIFMQSVTAVA